MKCFQKGNELTKSTCEAKKILCPTDYGLKYKKIHTCLNDCILFISEYKELNACRICVTSSYKIRKNNVANQVLKRPLAKML